jgi:hypothetical protein
MDTAEVTRNLLMYFVLPVWLVAGFADYLCHRAAHIERTSGPKESLLHLLQFGEMAVPVLTALLFEINALVILVMIICFLLHEATAIWDVRYATATREVTPIEKHVHSFLEMLPLMGLLMVIALHWQEFVALFGLSDPSFAVVPKQGQPSWGYILTVLFLVLCFELLPYIEELLRGMRARWWRYRERGFSCAPGVRSKPGTIAPGRG